MIVLTSAKSVDPDERPHSASCISSGSSLFANVPFRDFQYTKGQSSYIRTLVKGA